MLVRAGDVLRENYGDPLVSRYWLKQAKGIALVRSNRDEGRQPLAFVSRPFVLCGLPVRRPLADRFLFERRNGSFLLRVTGHPQFGRPFGQDRLVLGFFATLAVRQSSRTAATVAPRSRFSFLRENGPNTITLSDEFYGEISAHPIQADLEAVKVLAASPALLDLYVWLGYRCFCAKGSESIPLFGPFGLTMQLGCVEYSRPSRFRAMLEQWLRTIKALWPESPATVSHDGKFLRLGRSVAVPGSQVASKY